MNADPARWLQDHRRVGPAAGQPVVPPLRRGLVALRYAASVRSPPGVVSPVGNRGAGVNAATLRAVAAPPAPMVSPPHAASRSLARLLALWASLALHAGAAAMLLISAAPEALVAGGAVVQVTLVGNDLLDLAAGGIASAPAPDMPVDPADPAEPATAAVLLPAEPAPILREVVRPVEASAAAMPAAPSLPPVIAAIAPVVDRLAILPLSPVLADAGQPARAATISPVAPAGAMPARPPSEALQPLPDQPPEAWAQTVRPQRRPATPPPEDTPVTPAEKRQTARAAPAAAAPPGNSDRDARRGSADGADAGAAQGAAKAGAADTASGNDAASNYPGLVLRKIERTRRAKGAGRGTAVVSFSIAASGGLASVSVIRSSGNARLDDMAADHIRRAAPFAPPPAGAQRKFRFEFVGR